MTRFAEPVVAWAAADDEARPLVVLLHGRGADESGIIGLADHLPTGPSYAAVRAPIGEGSGYAWFVNRGIGRPVAESLAETMAWFRSWLDDVAPVGRPVVLVGFSGGAAFAGGLLLGEPSRFAGAAILHGTLPFDAGIPVTAARLAGVPVFVAQGENDTVIPRELLDRTWTYLLTDSGARMHGRRGPGGHGITADTGAELGGWIAEQLQALTRRDPLPAGLAGAVLTSRAEVMIDSPARYAKQLLAHLGRKLDFTTDGATSTAGIGKATGQIISGAGALTLVATGPDEDSVARAEHVLGSHLERFGQRNDLRVSWTRDPVHHGADHR